MKDSQEALKAQFSEFFDIHLSRLKCLSALVLSLIQVRTVNLSELSLSLNGSVSASTNYKRLQRFFRLFVFPFDSLSKLIWSLFDEGEIPVLSLDRTNWKFGRANINILMLSICYQGIGIPLMWTVLEDKRGNSSVKERIVLMERFLKLFKPAYVVRLVADREFIGTEWLDWLDSNHIHYIIRIRKNQLVESEGTKRKQAWQLFNSDQVKLLRKPRTLDGINVYLGGKKLPDGDYLILISNLPLKKGFYYYARRWEIETLFGALKTRGFRFETTHMSITDRIDKLTAVLALALAWAVKVGVFKTNNGKSIPIKKHRRRARSIFRIGLDEIRARLLNFNDLDDLIKLLSCT